MLKHSLLMLVMASLLSGCDQVSNQISDLFSKPTVEKTIAKMQTLASDEKQEKAIEVGEAFVSKYPDPSNQVREQLVKLYLEKGSPTEALRHMQAFSASKGLAEPSPGSPRPDSSAPAASKGPIGIMAPRSNSTSVDGASVRTGPDGTEVRAGDAVIKINK